MTTAAMSKVTEPVGLPDMKVSVRQSRRNNSRQGMKGPVRDRQAKLRRDSQGSLPKSASSAYLNDKATEL